jgi:tetratricopeptide (TPR) repeat protein
VQVLPVATAEDCLRELDEALAIARRIGWRPGEAFALGNSGMLWTARGDYAMALDRSEASLALAREIGHAQWEVLAHLALFELWLALRDEERGMAHGRRGLDMARSVGSRHLQRSVAGVLAARLARWGAGAALAQAERDVASALDAGATPEDAQTIGQRHCWVGRAEIALARGDAASALQVADALLGSLPNLGAPGTTGTGPVLAHLRGRCCIALGRYAEAARELQSVRAIAAAHGARTLELRAELGFVALFRARGSTAELDDAQARCRALAQSLAATIPEAAARKRYLDWMHAEIGE